MQSINPNLTSLKCDCGEPVTHVVIDLQDIDEFSGDFAVLASPTESFTSYQACCVAAARVYRASHSCAVFHLDGGRCEEPYAECDLSTPMIIEVVMEAMAEKMDEALVVVQAAYLEGFKDQSMKRRKRFRRAFYERELAHAFATKTPEAAKFHQAAV